MEKRRIEIQAIIKQKSNLSMVQPQHPATPDHINNIRVLKLNKIPL